MNRKSALISLFLVLNSFCFADLKPGFSQKEARDMIAICNSFSFLELYQSDADILPKGYKKTYTSGIFGMDNKYQIYQSGNVAVINLRGSTDKPLSWIENFYSAMIPAKGTIKIEDVAFNYCFAKDKQAAVHSGYALSIGYLHKELLSKIKELNKNGIFNIIITGHSQGGALASMFRAYIENLSPAEISKKNIFKVYTFGAPMIGNKEFTTEYNNRFCELNTSFSIINESDIVPTLPLGYNDTNYIADNIKTLFMDKESFSVKKVISNGGVLIFKDPIGKIVKKAGASTSKKISKDLGQVVMPKYVDDFNYNSLGNTIELEKFNYPKILKDSGILKNDSLMRLYTKGADGHFTEEKLYQKESMTYQHKSYNYYVAILKVYFPMEYKLLKRKYLPENL